MLSIGLMSGTSMDGIDAALIETDGTHACIKELAHISVPYDPDFIVLLKAAEATIRKHHGDLIRAEQNFSQGLKDYWHQELKQQDAFSNPVTLSDVIQRSTDLHANAVKQLLKKSGYSDDQIEVVGYHGQAMFHRPTKRISIIVGDGQSLANQLGMTVVSDFRSCDIQAGGNGAPFAPLYHLALAIRDRQFPLTVVNCGGISNITLINSEHESDLIAFDCGPGNALLDKLIRQFTSGNEHMDRDGQYGKRGVVNQSILQLLFEKSILQDGQNFFHKAPPKSLDSGDLTLIPELSTLNIEDACATLAAFTADSIVKSLENITAPIPRRWVLAGGGWKNPVIRQQLESRLNQRFNDIEFIATADEIGWNTQAMEAQLFAYLAVRSLQNKPLSLPGTTRVPVPMPGGQVHYPL